MPVLWSCRAFLTGPVAGTCPSFTFLKRGFSSPISPGIFSEGSDSPPVIFQWWHNPPAREGCRTRLPMTERFFSLNAALMPRATTSSAEGTRMAGAVKKLVCCLLLLALAGTAFAGYGTAVMADWGAPAHNQVTGSHHGDRGLLRVTGDPGKNNFDLFGCYYRWITCLRIMSASWSARSGAAVIPVLTGARQRSGSAGSSAGRVNNAGVEDRGPFSRPERS